MNSKNLFRNLVAFAALTVFTGVMTTPTLAEGKKAVKAEKCACGKEKSKCADCQKHASAKKGSKAKTVASTKMYECQHCKEPMTLTAAQGKGMKCCGMKMVEVKVTKKSENKKKG